MSDIIHRLVAHAQAAGDGGGLQPRPDYQLLPDALPTVDESATFEPGITEAQPGPAPLAPPASANREHSASVTVDGAPHAVGPRRRSVPEAPAAVPDVPLQQAPEVAAVVRTTTPATDGRPAPVRHELPEHVPGSIHGRLPAERAIEPEAAPAPVAPAATAASQQRRSPPDALREPGAPRRHEPTPRVTQPPAAAIVAASLAPVMPRIVLDMAAEVEPAPSTRRAARVPEAREASRSAESPTIHVTIGRLEVRAALTPQAPLVPRVPQQTGLGDYLRARAAGERR